jgi:ferredoxin-type protein NapG
MDYSRRQFFNSFKRVIDRAVEQPRAKKKTIALKMLRPPGAIEESQFLEKCTRCTDCIEACPYDSIRRIGPEFGEAAGTPAIIYNDTPCYICPDMPCIASCETEALLPIERHEARMGTATIDYNNCWQAMNQPCDYCVTKCPLKSDAISMDEIQLPRVDTNGCVGCGVCAYLCPGDAITIVAAEVK